ncbi:hypothetical protein CRENBAI_013080, partial [Crenichthys baileyi]
MDGWPSRWSVGGNDAATLWRKGITKEMAGSVSGKGARRAAWRTEVFKSERRKEEREVTEIDAEPSLSSNPALSALRWCRETPPPPIPLLYE